MKKLTNQRIPFPDKLLDPLEKEKGGKNCNKLIPTQAAFVNQYKQRFNGIPTQERWNIPIFTPQLHPNEDDPIIQTLGKEFQWEEVQLALKQLKNPKARVSQL